MKTSYYFALYSLFVIFLLHKAVYSTFGNGCPGNSSKWNDFGGDFCYIVEKYHTATWIDAVYNCFLEGGSLASFHSADEVRRVVQNIKDEEIRYYIGLWKHYDGSLEWSDKSPLDFRNWNSGEPNLDFEKCVEMYYHSGKWNDVACTLELGYICSSVKNKPPSGPKKFCPYTSIKWEHFGGDVCYIIEKEDKAKWIDALHRCSVEGGSLASFHSIGEISSVLQRTKHHHEKLHIGLRQGDYGEYYWTDGSPISLDYWNSEEPNNNEEMCTFMSSQSGRWYEEHCGKVAGYVCSSPKDFCGGDIHSDGGVIYSPDYPLYTGKNDCTWRITVPEDHQVVLQFQRFDVENSSDCLSDFVQVYDVVKESSSRLLGIFCGSSIPPILRSSENKMDVRFVTDSINDRLGFLAEFNKGCDADFDSERGNFSSPNYPDNYGSHEMCTWKITVPENRTVVLQFLSIDLQYSSGCTADFVEIRDGHEPGSPLLAKFCDATAHQVIPFRSWTNKMSVTFVSDSSVQRKGFTAIYMADSKLGCDEDIFAEKGVIQSPNFPNAYEPGLKCVWNITVPENYRVSLKFLTFDVQSSNICQDFVDILDGQDPGSRHLGRFCGSDVPDSIVSTENNLKVVFTSDLLEETTGFSAEFVKDDCGGYIFAESGVISSPNFPEDYRVNEDCTWKIKVPENHQVFLQFHSFDLEDATNCAFDFVEVRDGHGYNSPLLDRLCGTDVPETIRSSKNKISVTFVSDTSFQRQGFNATFSKDASAYEHLEVVLRELPTLVLQHKMPKAKERLLSKQSKNSFVDLLGRIISP